MAGSIVSPPRMLTVPTREQEQLPRLMYTCIDECTAPFYHIQAPKIGRFSKWDTVPTIARIILTIPREKSAVLESPTELRPCSATSIAGRITSSLQFMSHLDRSFRWIPSLIRGLLLKRTERNLVASGIFHVSNYAVDRHRADGEFQCGFLRAEYHGHHITHY